jgi:tellurite resistance protein TerC
MEISTVGTPLLWGGFLAFVLLMLALDLGVFHRKAHSVSAREALVWTIVWIALAVLFGAGIWAWRGPETGLMYFTGYVLEKALAVDNIFVFVLVFSAFGIAPKNQHRVLFWGILGALVMRGAFIFAGAALVERFHWLLYVFGGVLVLTAVKLLLQKDEQPDPRNNWSIRMLSRFIPFTHDDTTGAFIVRRDGRRLATPLLLALVVLEATDLVFAVDSIPAVFAITTDPFLVFTSNIFAILGLRSMYFLLASVIGKLRYLKIGLAAILAFVGLKMVLAAWVKIPVLLSLAVIAAILLVSVVVSLLRPADLPHLPADGEEHGRRPGPLPHGGAPALQRQPAAE